jgi:nitroimidazol reductase NimA-like FMN-containing flavoprotein (pyridoxamine 5'-phosphate oxidase superfamily)
MAMPVPRSERPEMADYGVPDSVGGALPWEWASERLIRNRNYWVVTADAAGRPAAMPVWGVWDDDGFMFSCSPNSRKARNLAGNPHAVVMADDTVEVVSVEGVATLIDDAEERFAVAAVYAAKYEDDPEKRAEMVGFISSHAMYRLVPQRAFGIIEREEEFASKATRWVW